jgi:hypothetical protein
LDRCLGECVPRRLADAFGGDHSVDTFTRMVWAGTTNGELPPTGIAHILSHSPPSTFNLHVAPDRLPRVLVLHATREATAWKGSCRSCPACWSNFRRSRLAAWRSLPRSPDCSPQRGLYRSRCRHVWPRQPPGLPSEQDRVRSEVPLAPPLNALLRAGVKACQDHNALIFNPKHYSVGEAPSVHQVRPQ